jgi:hypothetical protein
MISRLLVRWLMPEIRKQFTVRLDLRTYFGPAYDDHDPPSDG